MIDVHPHLYVKNCNGSNGIWYPKKDERGYCYDLCYVILGRYLRTKQLWTYHWTNYKQALSIVAYSELSDSEKSSIEISLKKNL